MKMRDMMDILGETMIELHATPYKSDDFDGILKKAEFETKIAKQFINGADITLRADKMRGRTENIDRIME